MINLYLISELTAVFSDKEVTVLFIMFEINYSIIIVANKFKIYLRVPIVSVI